MSRRAMNHPLALCIASWQLIAGGVLAGCGAPPEPAPEGQGSSDLLGAVSYGSDCNTTDKQFLANAMHYGRTVAVSNAFAQCMSKSVNQQSGSIGAYKKCNGDPFYSDTAATQLSKVLDATRSTVDVSINCTGGTGNASTSIDTYGHVTPEGLSFSAWLRAVDTTLAWPVCNGSNGPNCRYAAEPWPWSQAAGIIWHEAMHQQGYTHGANDQASAKVACGYSSSTDAQWNFQVNTMPYIVENCISEVISRSGRICGAPLESGAGLKLITDFDGTTCSVAQDPQEPTVSWSRVGTPGSAAQIAACSESLDGRVYALNYDHTLWVSHSSGADGSWQYVQTPGAAQQIFCAKHTLYAFNNDRTLWRNDGSDAAVSWTYVGRPGGAKRIAAATQQDIYIPIVGYPNWYAFPALYALNDDNTLWKSTSGADGTWTYLGQTLGVLDRIAVGGAIGEARPFGLAIDYSVWLNAGDGCSAYWYKVGNLPYAAEIAASSATTLYALGHDHSLWKGTVRGADWLTTYALGKSRHCDGTKLVPNN